ncbi:nitric oxide reductase activation protein NorD [Ammoniphilus sp. CFH 90114]|uniref:vWA domain-containing protein n=1 Tax=Ammoniphilus sp. CFH 90114 TaxID=2493665 RepID=UPI00100F034F|nr:VWA domain-containing protein [Ammoniphilus sp. CFH 90114]RXT15250.1 VWA domain-containing protein [Ammoniphilus sp. CFH 90114]
MKYIVFNNKKVDTGLFMQLQDLAGVLTGFPELKFKFDYGHYLDLENKVMTASHFWDNLLPLEREAGYKTDIYLRAIGTVKYTDAREVYRYVRQIEEYRLNKFAIQVFTLLEDMRLEEICKKKRPGTSKWFQIRKKEYQKYFESQLTVNLSRGYHLDAMFCLIYLTLQADSPDPYFADISNRQQMELEGIKPTLYESFESRRTQEVSRIAERIVASLSDLTNKDSLNEYFILPFLQSQLKEEGISFDDLKRQSKLKNNNQDDHHRDSEEAKQEKMPKWHGETKEGEQSRAFLQFDLESGTQTEMLGNAIRGTEDGDQAMGTVQGKTRASDKKNYNQMEAELNKIDNPAMGGRASYGEENRDAVLILKEATTPSIDDEQLYQAYLFDVETYIRKLSKTIENTLEHKRSQPRQGLAYGRLSKNLLPIVLDDFPKVFYKKDHQSKEIDAVFTLLVDCSASMHNKMEETKRGITLFHEVLKKLNIPHTIAGFWEDANRVKEGYQPNYYHLIKDFHQSIYNRSGAEIMQLEPQEDNRDGFSIRVAAQELKRRREKNKFLLIFSDGEPAAAKYDQNGIIDTKEAVIQTRRQGIEVLGMFLSNGEISEEEEKTMQNIYDKEYIMVPTVEELPEQFAPILKKLLLKSI